MQLKRFALGVLLIFGCLVPASLRAQDPMMQQLPIDPAVRMGTLPNGLTYIIRHNENPKNRANYYIAQKVGSVLEEDSQAGLAHFLEHMAFNGTKNFPGKNLIGFLERIGCQFGADLNAYTAFDETVYTIMDAPTDKGIEIIDSCLLIMHDWSNNITLDGKEIDEERGVIHEEWRSRDNASLRMLTAQLPKVLPNNKYANRMPIGTMEVVDNFKHNEIRDFYHKWYRPDLQGIIVVGDIDVDYVEKKLKEIFADVPAPQNPAERYFVQVEDNATPIVALATDKEATSTNISVMFKHDVLSREEKGSIAGALVIYMEAIATQIINERFNEITIKPNAPFLRGGAFDYNYMGIAKTKNAFTFMAIAKDGAFKPAFEALVAEIQRVKQHGFLKSEYDRARTDVLKMFEDQFKARADRKNGSFCEEYKNYFLDGGYIPGIEVEKQLMEMIAEQVTPEMVAQYIQEMITTDGKNLVITVTGPKKDGITYPTEAEIIALYNECVAKPVEAKKEEVIDTNLIDKDLKGGKIVKEKKNQKFGTTELTLQNGIKVYLKKTDFKEDQILMSGTTNGGFRLYSKPSDILNTKIVDDIVSLGGLGKFDAIALGKALTGRTVSVSPAFGNFTSGFSGNSTVADFETMLQLTYLYMTDIRADKEAFAAYKEKTTEALKMAERQPFASLSDSINYLLFDNDIWRKKVKADDMEKVSYERALQMARERLSSADGFQFFFVGNIDEAKAKDLIVKYLGSVPKGKATPKMDRTKQAGFRKGEKTMEVYKDMNTPTGIVMDYLQGKAVYDHKTILTAQILNGVLDQTLIASIRERESGTYSPSAAAEVDEFPTPEGSVTVQFFCAPERAAQLNQVVYDELNLIVKNGVSQEYFDKTVVNMKKRHAERIRENGYWLGNIEEYFFNGKNWVDNYDKVLDSIKPADVQALLKSIVTSGNRLQLYFRSTQTEADQKK